ncbi:MAG: chromosome segregation SMC family protein, partial [Pirellulales bacterium]
MLKALEIVGFKSFADKTRLEFHRGITVVVGPNGSGKSNVVDAVKWVLGEQSVKSLRGKEMADVIFNGSGSRPPLNAAETTLTFDNSGKLLPIDTPEVHVTRRVYRNGEGEYLINRQPCRLRDIRDLLAGTGVGSEGYSVIEQGKVDALLQTSTRERRVIFEEAAGISRFRAKKVESLRRLERVDQNLLRLNDIVEEVDSRLRSVRNQAGKARRYREHAGRLQELRTQVGLADWRKLSSQLAEQESIIQAQRDEADVQAAKIEALEAESLALDDALVSLDEAVRTCEAQLARDREQISSAETTVEHERSRCGDLEVEIARHRHQYAAIKARSGDLDQQIATTQSAVAAAEQQHQSITGELAAGELSVSDLTSQMRALRQENEERRTACLEEMRTGAMLGNEISGLEAQLSALSATRQRVQQRLEELAQSRWTLAAELQALERNHASLAEMAARRQDEVLQAQHDLAEKRQTHSARTQDMSRLRQRLAGQQERIAVLDELEQRLEGHTAGVKEAIGRARGETPGPYRQVVGLVAELLRVDLELAPLIEALLGETAGHVVISPGEELLSHLLSEEGRPPGRLGLVGWDGAEPAETSERPIHFQGREGVVGPAEQFVQVEPAYEGLKRRLLGDAWVVDTLSRARQLAAEAPSARFITQSGELLGTDRTIILNARQSGAGFI